MFNHVIPQEGSDMSTFRIRNPIISKVYVQNFQKKAVLALTLTLKNLKHCEGICLRPAPWL